MLKNLLRAEVQTAGTWQEKNVNLGGNSPRAHIRDARAELLGHWVGRGKGKKARKSTDFQRINVSLVNGNGHQIEAQKVITPNSTPQTCWY